MRIDRPKPLAQQEAGHRITELWAWTVIDPLTDVEGIAAVTLVDGRSLPMVASIREKVERFRPFIRTLARRVEAPVRLRHFMSGFPETVDEVTPW